VKKFFVVCGVVSCVFLTACAVVGSSFSKEYDNLPAIEKGLGRIFVYRQPSFMGFVVPLVMRLDGINVGDIQESSVFYLDVMTGAHQIGLADGKQDPIEINIKAGKETFIKIGKKRINKEKDSQGPAFDYIYSVSEKTRNEAFHSLQNLQLIETRIRTWRSLAPGWTEQKKTIDERLRKIDDLRQKELISQQEYDAKRKEILGAL
jgi:hypothetical protein